MWEATALQTLPLTKMLKLKIFRCENHRCLDPAQCCDPNLDPSCPYLNECCVPLIENRRHYYKMGVERRNNQDLKFIHSTIYTVTGEFDQAFLDAAPEFHFSRHKS